MSLDLLLFFFCFRSKYNLDCTLELVRKDSFELIFRFYHCCALRMVTVESNSVEFTLCRTYTAADTLIRVNDCSTAAETARSFNLHLLLCKCNVVVLE